MPAARFRWRGRTAKPLRSTRRAIGRSTASRSKVPTADRSRRSAKTADSFFEDVRQTDDEVIFILAGGETIRLPKAKEVNFVIERTTLTLKYGQTEKLAVTQKGVESYSISKPDGVARFARRRRAVDHGSRRREYLCRKERQGDGRRRGRYGDGRRCGRSQSSGVRRQQRRFERLGGVELTDK